MREQDIVDFRRTYGDKAQEVIDAFRELEPYARDPTALVSELRDLGRQLGCSGRKPAIIIRISEALRGYAERLKANQERGLPVTIKQGDLSCAFRFEFSELDDAVDEVVAGRIRNFGKKTYTGQTDLGVKPGYSPRHVR